MTASAYQGVILAAGEGSRMGPLGDQLPKALVPICNQPLLTYQLDHMRSLGIKDVIIVVGYLRESIENAFGDGLDFDLNIRYVEQRERLGLAHAVGQLESQIDGPFVLMLGDIYFDIPNLKEMVHSHQSTQAAAVLAVKDETSLEAIQRNFSVVADEQGRVSEVVEKPSAPTTTFKGCGVYIFDSRIFEAIRNTPRSSLRNEYELTDAIQVLIESGAAVQAVDIVRNDINITYISDIIDANVYELTTRELSSIQGDRAQLHAGCVLSQSVIGDDIQIPHAITLDECVVLDGSIIRSTSPLQRAVITPFAILT